MSGVGTAATAVGPSNSVTLEVVPSNCISQSSMLLPRQL